ncbi:transcription termination/antitermination protein NusA, partial [Candidatus Saccharibacteria bacterium]
QEKIDIITFSDDSKNFISNALSPAEISRIEIDETAKRARVLVNEDQQSIAIGRGGQNVRLASRLTGYELDIEQVNDAAAPKPERKPRNIEDSLLSAIEETDKK